MDKIGQSLSFSCLCITSFFIASPFLEAGLFSKKRVEIENTSSHSCLNCVCEKGFGCPTSGDGFSFYGEYLFWNVWEEGLELAGKGSLSPGNIQAVDFNWKSGFKAGIGGNFYSGWGINAEYTYLRPKGHKEMTSSGTNHLYPLFISNLQADGFQWDLGQNPFALGISTAFTAAKGAVSLQYNTIDLEIERALCCLPCFDFLLMGGAQGAWIKQHFQGNFNGVAHVKYKGQNLVQEAVDFSVQANQSWKFCGGGLKVGAAGEYHHPCGFLLFTKGCVNLLFGKYNNTYTSTVNNIGSEVGTTDAFGQKILLAHPVVGGYYQFSGTEPFCDFTTNAQVNMGLGFEYLGSCGSLRLDVGYEFVYWRNLAQMRQGLANSVDYIEPFKEATSVIFTDRGETQRISSSVGLQGLMASLIFKF